MLASADIMRMRGITEEDMVQARRRTQGLIAAAVPDSKNNTYTMDHSASFYVFDKTGQARVLINGTAPADQLAADIKSLLD